MTLGRLKRDEARLLAVPIVLSLLAQALGGAQVALAPVWAALAYLVFVRAPLRDSAKALVVLGLFLEPPDMAPGCGFWSTPVRAAGEVFHGPLRGWLLLPGLVPSLGLLATLTVLWRTRKVRLPKGSFASRADRALRLSVGTTVALVAWGLLRGGAPEAAYRQSIQLASTMLLAVAVLRVASSEVELEAWATSLLRMVGALALVRSTFVLVGWVLFARPAGLNPVYVTTHGDSVVFVVGLSVFLARFLVEPSRKRFIGFVLALACVLPAMVLNNRRLAFVQLAGAFAVSVLLLPKGQTRNRISIGALVLALGASGYVAAFGQADGPLFAPARLVSSVLAQQDTSSESRDVENENLIATAKAHFPVGQGFGHEYEEVREAVDLTQFFAEYKYVAHNSVLWVVGIAGPLGFALLWLPFGVVLYGCAEGARSGRSPRSRVAGIVGACAVVACLAMSWGDMGLVSATNAAAFAFAMALARVGAPDAQGSAAPATVTQRAYASATASS